MVGNAVTERRLSRRALLLAGAGSLALALAGCGRDNDPSEPVPEDPGYPDSSLFSTPVQVQEMLGDDNLVILDCSDLPAYRRGHLPGARHIWWQDTIEIHNPVYGMLVNQEGRAELARRAGVRPESRVLCYDDAGGTYAARVAWALRYMGFRSTSIMAGGTGHWRAAGFELTRDEPPEADGEIPDIFDESIVAHPQDILARQSEPGLVLLDTRTEGERAETWHGRLAEGMIPGSLWIPRDRFLTGDNFPVPAAELRALLEEQLVLEDTAEVIVYGLHGALACLPYYLLLALDRFHVRLYDGSWAQWGSDEGLPSVPLRT